ncbi:pentapeptide repeat-containing protein [Chryseobacterium sp.]|uniref:pentapeptide repeat-containing protein n=1 Tax=Chryseobacterium sp. TaxID=1871047 RepID=UPI0025B9BA3E|nr:pentapeptide repeat-containing protein [Chryseobacterium sp.]MBV8325495.1 pentapeptide repeat-containing protein [Chryseobacterium sp.]
MNKKELIERWVTDPGFTLVQKEIAKLSKKGGRFNLANSSVGEYCGKIDFRGIPLDSQTISGLKFINIDFSFSTFEHSWVEKSIFENCLFEKADFSDFSEHQDSFTDCVFKDCKFNLSAIGYDGTSFSGCIFENCKFNRTIFNRPEFVDVVFKNCKIKNIDFSASSFENCSFEGVLQDVWFRGGYPLQSEIERFGIPKKNEMKNVSFEKAELIYPTFSNHCDLSTVKINPSGNYYKYDRWKERLESLESEILNWEDKEEKKEAEIFSYSYLVHAKTQEWHIINTNDVERDHGKDIALKIINHLNNFS